MSAVHGPVSPAEFNNFIESLHADNRGGVGRAGCKINCRAAATRINRRESGGARAAFPGPVGQL